MDKLTTNQKVHTSQKTSAIMHPPSPPVRIGVRPHSRDPYLWDTVLRPLGHWVGHGQVVHHHDVLVGLVHCRGRLRPRADRRTAVGDGSSRRLYLRPLKKLGKAERRFVIFFSTKGNKLI